PSAAAAGARRPRPPALAGPAPSSAGAPGSPASPVSPVPPPASAPAPARSPAGPGRDRRETSRGPDDSAAASCSPLARASVAGVAPPARDPERERLPVRAPPAAAAGFSVRSTASSSSSDVSSSSQSAEESPDPGPADDGRRRLRPPRDPRRRRLRTTTASSPPPVGAGPPSPCSGRARATGSSEAGWTSGTLSSDMEPFPRAARHEGAPAPAGRPGGQRGAQRRMVRGAAGARIDLVKLGDVTTSGR